MKLSLDAVRTLLTSVFPSEFIDDCARVTEEITASIQQISSGLDEQAEAMDEVARRATEVTGMSDDLYERADLFKVRSDQSANLEQAR